MHDTKRKVIVNLAWRFAERTGAQLVQFIVSIILARILTPEDYGTVALITVFISVMQVFVDGGLGNALIQKKNADNIDFSTVFYTNIGFCIILYVVLYLLSPTIATFYNNQSLISLIRILGLTIVISGVKNVQQAYVSRRMLFKKFFWSTLAGTIIAAVVGITAALRGAGVWALVFQQLINLTIDTVVLWITVKWRPQLIFSLTRLKQLFSYGWKLLTSSLLNSLYDNLRQLIIGKMYSTTNLAFYNRGRQFPNLIVNNVNSSIDSVLLPTLSQEQDDKTRIKQMTQKVIKISMFIMSPLLVGLAFASPNIIKVLLNDEWLPAIPYVAIFSIVFLLWPIHTANLNAIKAIGRSDIFLRLEIIKLIIGIIVLIFSMQSGVFAIAIGMLVSGLISQAVNAWPNRKLISYSYFEQLRDIAPSVIAAFFMGAVIYPLNLVILPPAICLIVQVALGAIMYILIAKTIKNDSYLCLKQMLKNMHSPKQ